MKTLIATIPEKEEGFITTLMKKFRFKAKIVSNDDFEDEAIAHWIDEGLGSKDLPASKLYEYLKKHGVDC